MELMETKGIPRSELWDEGEEPYLWNAKLYPACPTIKEALDAALKDRILNPLKTFRDLRIPF